MFGGGFSKDIYDKANSKRLMILEKHFSSNNTMGRSSITQHNDNTEEEMKTETQLLRTNNGNQPQSAAPELGMQATINMVPDRQDNQNPIAPTVDNFESVRQVHREMEVTQIIRQSINDRDMARRDEERKA